MLSEYDWLTTDDHAAMWRHVEAQASEQQCEAVVRACRSWSAENRKVTGDEYGVSSGITWKEDASFWMAIAWFSVSETFRASLLHEVFGNPFRILPTKDGYQKILMVESGESGEMSTFVHLHTILQWRNGTVPKIARRLWDGEECKRCEGDAYVQFRQLPGWIKVPCSDCKATGWKPPTFDARDMAILADAYEEAGGREQAIVEHLRGTEVCPWCDSNLRVGCIVKSTHTGRRGVMKLPISVDDPWVCEQCLGTKLRKPHHVRGCWAVALLRGEA